MRVGSVSGKQAALFRTQHQQNRTVRVDGGFQLPEALQMPGSRLRSGRAADGISVFPHPRPGSQILGVLWGWQSAGFSGPQRGL